MFKKTPEEAETHLLIKVCYVKDFVSQAKPIKGETAKRIYANLLKELQKELREVEDANSQKPCKLFLTSINRGRETENLLIEAMEGLC